MRGAQELPESFARTPSTAVPSEPFERIRCYPLGRIGAEIKTRNERKKRSRYA
jgi:hypothetical protein